MLSFNTSYLVLLLHDYIILHLFIKSTQNLEYEGSLAPLKPFRMVFDLLGSVKLLSLDGVSSGRFC